jgi:glycosyltransferase involved in cell wall biosynthesis
MLQASSSQANGSLSDTGKPLRIGFFDYGGWDYHVLSPEAAPLGGSHSAACYLARALAAQGHSVFLVTNLSKPGRYANVQCMSWDNFDQAAASALKLDACVCILGSVPAAHLRQLLDPAVRLVLWTQHDTDQPSIQNLRDPAEREAFDGFALVSVWQSLKYQSTFGIPPQRIAILRNAVAPAFLGLFPPAASILSHKIIPPVLAYTSTPYRGLDLLLDAFSRIRSAIPGTTLRVYSSMQVYRAAPQQEQSEFGALYQRCRQTPGVTYHGSILQSELAPALREVSMLAYPNTYPETSCIAVLEAMAAGCRVVTSRHAALPETTGGFGTLIDMPATSGGHLKVEDYLKLFVDAVAAALQQMQSQPVFAEAQLRKQVDFVNQLASWPLRARQWADWLRRLPRHR